MAFTKRRVVTGHDPDGAPIVVSDGPPAACIVRPSGSEQTTHWHLPAPPRTPDEGGDEPPDLDDFVPPQGGASWRFMQLPPRGGQPAAPADDPRFDKDRPGFHATPTIDFIEIVQGSIRLELDEEAVDLGPGDCVIQRGTSHRWIVTGDDPCLFSALMLAVGPGPGPGFQGVATGTLGPRRIVTGGPGIVSDGRPGTGSKTASGVTTVELWQTLGPVVSVEQGGDVGVDRMQLNPIGGGVAWKHVTIPAAAAEAAAMMHTTPTIDFVRIAEGTVDLELPGQPPVRLGAGDCVVQRGTEHAWRNAGDGPFTLSAVMVGVADG